MLPDTVLLLTLDGQCVVLSSKRKCDFLVPAMYNVTEDVPVKSLKLLTRNKSDDNAENIEEMLAIAKTGCSTGNDFKIGVLLKEFKPNDNAWEGSNLAGWKKALKSDSSKVVDVTGGISLVMAVKDKDELLLLKKSSVLSNKVLKHGFFPKIEDAIDNDAKVTHKKLAADIEGIIKDPSKIKLNVPKEAVESCYFPIVQSGGVCRNKYVKFDVITVSLGARYCSYSSKIIRTFFVDVPEQVSKTYKTLLGVHEACLKAMVPGKPFNHVYAAAVKYLVDEGMGDLVSCLPKNLGSAVGIGFCDTHLLCLNAKNTVTFKLGMVVSLAVSFAGLELSESARSSLNSKSAVST